MAAKDEIKLKIDGVVYTLDPDDLELGELVALEDLTGKPYSEVDFESAKAMLGMAWVMIHRANANFTVEDAGRLKVSAFADPYPPTKAVKKAA